MERPALPYPESIRHTSLDVRLALPYPIEKIPESPVYDFLLHSGELERPRHFRRGFSSGAVPSHRERRRDRYGREERVLTRILPQLPQHAEAKSVPGLRDTPLLIRNRNVHGLLFLRFLAVTARTGGQPPESQYQQTHQGAQLHDSLLPPSIAY